MSSETPLVDLHGAEGQPFPSFGEDWSYLERVTITTRSMAQNTLARESGMNPDEHDPQPIYMRRMTAEHTDHEGLIRSFDELPAWFECDAENPDAVPFWKAAP